MRIRAFPYKEKHNALSAWNGHAGGVALTLHPLPAQASFRREKEHDFKNALKEENRIAASPAWLGVYRRLFPGMVNFEIAPVGSVAQKRGVDRIVHLSDGSKVTVQEKYRLYRGPEDILIEYRHIGADGRGWPGWITHTSADYLFMAWLRARHAVLWRMSDVTAVWDTFGPLWQRRFGLKTARNTGYESLNVAISRNEFCRVAAPVSEVAIPEVLTLIGRSV